MQNPIIIVGLILLVGLSAWALSANSNTPLPPHKVSVEITSDEILDLVLLPCSRFSGSSWRWWRSDGDRLRLYLEQELISMGNVNLFSRQRLDELIQEQGIVAGTLDDEKAQAIASLTGVSTLLDCSVLRDTQSTEQIAPLPYPFGGTAVAKQHTKTLEVQLQMLDVKSGQIKFSEIFRQSATSGEISYDDLSNEVLQALAHKMAQTIAGSPLKEFRYGLFADIKANGDGFAGLHPLDQRAADEQAVLLIYVNQIHANDQMEIRWIDPLDSVVETLEPDHTQSNWLHSTLLLQTRPEGEWTVQVYINQTLVLSENFEVKHS